MAETGYMPPNKVANDVYLKDFYVKKPNNYTAVSQLGLLTKWYAFPGDNRSEDHRRDQGSPQLGRVGHPRQGAGCRAVRT